jgi:SAM-dependent methyltransferase
MLRAVPPVCPACAAAGRGAGPLALEPGWSGADGRVRDGVLGCRDAACGRRFPVLDGLAVLCPEPDRYLAEAGAYLLMRDDLADGAAELVGSLMPPGAWHDAMRQALSTYMRDHWGVHDPEDPGDPPAGSARALLDAALAAAGDAARPPPGPVVELGAAAGGVTAALAARLGRHAVGIDLSAPLARAAQRTLATGVAAYPLRERGARYAARRFPVPVAGLPAEVRLGDALAPPVAPGTAAVVVALNLFDCVADPAALVASAARLLRPGGLLVMSTPYDWSQAATPVSVWGGGDGTGPGLGETVARTPGLALAGDPVRRTWTLRLTGTSAMRYRVEVVVASKDLT